MNSNILHAIGYAITNEIDAHAIEGVVAIELDKYISEHPSEYPQADKIRAELFSNPEKKFFKAAYDQAKGTEEDKKRFALEQLSMNLAQHKTPNGKTFSEYCYQISIERDTTAKNGWIKMNDADFEKMESCLLGKIKPEEVADAEWMKGRNPIRDETSIIKQEWPTFCKRLMDGTFHSDVLPYFKDLKPANLIQTISPELAGHLKKNNIIPNSLEMKPQVKNYE